MRDSASETEISEELNAAIEFLREHVHRDYYLAEYLRYRIGYHYGTMPQFVRAYVKQLFENKRIVFLACTSTLLEGVNLPAKNLIVHKPRKGHVQPMDSMSIRNLIGRAGRLKMDYYGNIYCIDVKDWESGEEVFEDKPEVIESSSVIALSKHADELIRYLKDSSYEPTSSVVKSMATSLLIKQLLDPDHDFLSRFRNMQDSITHDNLDRIKSLLVQIVNDISAVDKKVLLRNRSIDPRFQHQLYISLRDEYRVLPAFPKRSRGFYENLKSIFQLVAKYLLREYDRRYEYYAYLASEWINETHYKRILDNQVARSLRTGLSDSKRKSEINQIIEDLNESLEDKIRFDYTRGLKCYTDLVQQVLSEQNVSSDYCRNLYMYLESGASTDNVLHLIGAGLSRNTAVQMVEILGRTALPRMETVMETVQWLRNNAELLKARLHPIVYKDVERVIGSQSLQS